MVHAQRITKRSLTATGLQRPAKLATYQREAASAAPAIVRKLADFRKHDVRFVGATSEVFWQALKKGLLPGQDRQRKASS